MKPPATLQALRRVCVGSANQPKIRAVRDAFAPFVPGLQVEGRAVESGVPDQPVGFPEIVEGARQRAREALRLSGWDLGVGLEDGLTSLPGLPGPPFNVGCAALFDGERSWLGFSGAFRYPPVCAELAERERRPIGELFDRLWEEQRGESAATPSALGVGNVGRLSLGVLPRAEYARHAVLCALLPLLHPDLYRAGEAGLEAAGAEAGG